MIQDSVMHIVRKILSDKILLGLLVICLLAVFVGGFNFSSSNREAAPQAATTEQSIETYGDNSQLSPQQATQFVKWWIRGAMDYTPSSAAQSHEAASHWTTPEAAKAFNDAFWYPQLAQQVTSGAAVGAFQPITVQAEAVNPDRTIVVGLTGTLVLQVGGQPKSHQIDMDLLVRKSKSDSGLRIAGLYNHLTSLSSSIY